MLASRREECAGGRFRASGGGGRAGGGGRRSRPGYGWIGSARRDADRRQEPGRAPGGAGDRGRARARNRRRRRAGAGLAGDPQPFRRRDRHQRQDDHRRAARPHLPHRRRAGRRRRQRRHAALARWSGEVEPDATVVCEASSFQLEDSVAFAPECAVFLNLAPDHLDRHADLESYLAAKLRIFANQGNDDLAVYNADEPALAGTRPRRLRPPGRLLPRRGPRLRGGASPRARSSTTASRCSRRRSWGCSASTTSPTRWPPPRRRSRWALDRDAVREGLRSFAGVPHRLEQVAEIGGVRSSTTRRRPTSPRPRVGLRAFEGGVHAILGGSEKGEPFAPLADPMRECCAACYLIGAAAERLGARAGAGRRGGRRAAPLRWPRGRRAACRRRGARPARSSCSRRPAPASTPSRTSNGAASASARSSRGCDEGAESGGRRSAGDPARQACPTEYNMLLTATLCLLAFGAVMVFSASSTTRVLSDGGLSDSAFYLKRTLMFGAVGLVIMHADRAPRAADRPPAHPAPCSASPVPPGRGAGRRHQRQRLQPLDRLRLPPAPALRAGQGRADPLRRGPARAQAETRPLDRGHDAVPPRRRRRRPADRRRAGPRHDAGRRLRRRARPWSPRGRGCATWP